MELRPRLAANLAAESKAYGYTLTVWGAGALLIDALGLPSVVEVLAYIGGALAGFAVLAFAAYRGLLSEREGAADAESPIVVSTIHVAATGGTVLLVAGVVRVADGTTSGWLVFLLVGVLVTVAYNVVLLAEEYVGTEML